MTRQAAIDHRGPSQTIPRAVMRLPCALPSVPLSSTQSQSRGALPVCKDITSQAKQWPPRSTSCKQPAIRYPIFLFLYDMIEHFFHFISSVYNSNYPVHA
jgi:hypothetical protein